MKTTETRRLVKQEAVEALCLRFHVQSLDLFGSATRDEGAANDYDFLVEFTPGAKGKLLQSYLGLADGLESALGKPVELLTPRSLKNPLFRQRVLDEKERVYERTLP